MVMILRRCSNSVDALDTLHGEYCVVLECPERTFPHQNAYASDPALGESVRRGALKNNKNDDQ